MGVGSGLGVHPDVVPIDPRVEQGHHLTVEQRAQRGSYVGDGWVRPTVYTLGAATGRRAGVRANRQNIPRTGGVENAACLERGVLLHAPVPAVELRYRCTGTLMVTPMRI